MDRNLNFCLQPTHQFVRHIGRQQTGHVLDADGIGSHIFHDPSHLDKRIHIVNWADGIAKRHLGDGAFPFDEFHRLFHVADVIQSIKDAKDVDAIVVSFDHKPLKYIVWIVLVADDVLPAEEHLKGCSGHHGFELADALPGVFVEKAHGRVEGSPTPHLH